MLIFVEVGMACRTSDFTEHAIEIAEEGAERNPNVATLTGLTLNLCGLYNRDRTMVAESVKILQHSPPRGLRAAGAEGYGVMLLNAGEREDGLHQLDAAWDDYDWMGAVGRRAQFAHHEGSRCPSREVGQRAHRIWPEITHQGRTSWGRT